MGATIAALQDALDTVVSNPLLFAFTLGAGIVGAVVGAIAAIIPIIGQLLTAPVFSVVTAGLIGMVALGAVGNRPVAVDDYVTTVTDRGVSVAIAAFLEQLVYLAIGVVFAIVFVVVVGFGTVAAGIGSPSPTEATAIAGSLGVLSIAAIFVLFAVLVILGTVFQFLTPAIVIDDESGLSAFRAAVGVVADNPVSVTGYTLLRWFLLLAAGLIAVAAATIFVEISTVLFVFGGLLAAVIFLFSSTFFYAYHSHYYLRLSDRPRDSVPGN